MTTNETTINQSLNEEVISSFYVVMYLMYLNIEKMSFYFISFNFMHKDLFLKIFLGFKSNAEHQ